mmetsp:Transcript_17147/g.26734  ORF Transcript_17147/g.26734 Transcript_17147/m.26734 type:complete len:324 (-) Transcript_17147:755-1726(-)
MRLLPRVHLNLQLADPQIFRFQRHFQFIDIISAHIRVIRHSASIGGGGFQVRRIIAIFSFILRECLFQHLNLGALLFIDEPIVVKQLIRVLQMVVQHHRILFELRFLRLHVAIFQLQSLIFIAPENITTIELSIVVVVVYRRLSREDLPRNVILHPRGSSIMTIAMADRTIGRCRESVHRACHYTITITITITIAAVAAAAVDGFMLRCRRRMIRFTRMRKRLNELGFIHRNLVIFARRIFIHFLVAMIENECRRRTGGGGGGGGALAIRFRHSFPVVVGRHHVHRQSNVIVLVLVADGPQTLASLILVVRFANNHRLIVMME